MGQFDGFCSSKHNWLFFSDVGVERGDVCKWGDYLDIFQKFWLLTGASHIQKKNQFPTTHDADELLNIFFLLFV